MIDSQKPGFDELFQAFFLFFLDSIGKDGSSWNKVRLQMMSQYFDDLALYKVINPIIARIQSNPEDRRAIARAALWDALMAHHMTSVFLMFKERDWHNEHPKTLPKPAIPFSVDQDIPETMTTSSAPEVQTIVVSKRGRPAGTKKL